MITIPDDIIALLLQCQALQSEKDGITRPDPRVTGVDEAETYDEFARRIQQACVTVSRHSHLQQLESDLATAGMALEREGRLQIGVGESYARAALDYLQGRVSAAEASDRNGEII